MTDINEYLIKNCVECKQIETEKGYLFDHLDNEEITHYIDLKQKGKCESENDSIIEFCDYDDLSSIYYIIEFNHIRCNECLNDNQETTIYHQVGKRYNLSVETYESENLPRVNHFSGILEDTNKLIENMKLGLTKIEQISKMGFLLDLEEIKLKLEDLKRIDKGKTKLLQDLRREENRHNTENRG